MNQIPNCDCHNEPKKWAKDSSSKHGGYWRCAVKLKEYTARYNRSERGRARWRRGSARYALKNPDRIQSKNDRRIMVNGMYFGMCGFTESEIKELANG